MLCNAFWLYMLAALRNRVLKERRGEKSKSSSDNLIKSNNKVATEQQSHLLSTLHALTCYWWSSHLLWLKIKVLFRLQYCSTTVITHLSCSFLFSGLFSSANVADPLMNPANYIYHKWYTITSTFLIYFSRRTKVSLQ